MVKIIFEFFNLLLCAIYLRKHNLITFRTSYTNVFNVVYDKFETLKTIGSLARRALINITHNRLHVCVKIAKISERSNFSEIFLYLYFGTVV